MKQRTHREWLRPVSCGGRKSCPECKAKLEPGESIWSWGEYVRARWHTVKHLCKGCWPRVEEELTRHRDGCGCRFELVAYHCNLPEWMKLPEPATTG